MSKSVTRPIGMAARYALMMMRDQAEKDGEQSEAEWLTKSDGTRPTVKEAIEWLETLDPDYDVVNGLARIEW